MSLVTLMSGSTHRTGDVVATRTWRLPVSGQAGDASFFVPYSSPLTDAIDLDAGILVLIHDADGVGAWSGVVLDAEWSATGITLSCQQPWAILGKRTTDLTGKRKAVAPGFLVNEIMQDKGLVLGMTMPDAPFDGDGPVVGIHTWDGQDVWGLVSDMMTRTENELWVDAETRQASWIGPLASANTYGEILIAGQSFQNWSYRESNAERVSEVVGIFTGQNPGYDAAGTWRYVARTGDSDVAGWPASATVTSDVLYVLRDVVHVEFNRRADPASVLTGEVKRSHRSIRERDFIQVFIPHRGLTLTCRVLARTVADDALTIGLELLAMPLSTTATSTKPPGLPSRDISRGTGALAQRVVRLNRRVR